MGRIAFGPPVLTVSARIQRLSQDQKAEQRPTPSFAERREAYVAKQHNRVLSAIRDSNTGLISIK